MVQIRTLGARNGTVGVIGLFFEDIRAVICPLETASGGLVSLLLFQELRS
jgi:hypothetical protein